MVRGPWLHSMDVERRVPHRLTSGLDRYTSLAASADGRRLVVTSRKSEENPLALANCRFQRRGIPAAPISLTTSTRVLAQDWVQITFCMFLRRGRARVSGSSPTELPRSCGVARERMSSAAQRSRPMASTSHSPPGEMGRLFLYVMQADGTNTRVLADSLDLQGAPAWAPDGQSITSAATITASHISSACPSTVAPPTPFVQEYSVDPAWAPNGRFLVYSGPDIGTKFSRESRHGRRPHRIPCPP